MSETPATPDARKAPIISVRVSWRLTAVGLLLVAIVDAVRHGPKPLSLGGFLVAVANSFAQNTIVALFLLFFTAPIRALFSSDHSASDSSSSNGVRPN